MFWPGRAEIMQVVRGSRVEVRYAVGEDADGVAGLARELAQSFPFSRSGFDSSYPALLEDPDACVVVAVNGEDHIGYLLGFRHLTFFAGPVALVEEILVRERGRRRGVGRALMSAFEQWAADRDCRLVALATHRAAPFYRALGYAESATYFRKVLEGQESRRPAD